MGYVKIKANICQHAAHTCLETRPHPHSAHTTLWEKKTSIHALLWKATSIAEPMEVCMCMCMCMCMLLHVVYPYRMEKQWLLTHINSLDCWALLKHYGLSHGSRSRAGASLLQLRVRAPWTATPLVSQIPALWAFNRGILKASRPFCPHTVHGDTSEQKGTRSTLGNIHVD